MCVIFTKPNFVINSVKSMASVVGVGLKLKSFSNIETTRELVE